MTPPTDDAPVAFFDMKAQQALIRAGIEAGIARVLDHGRFIQGPEVDALEEKLAAFAGVAHCVGVSSGTDALQIAMMAEGIGPGHAVFLPAFTYTATAEVPLLLGATPVFVDVDPRTFQIDPAHLAARVAAVRAAGANRLQTSLNLALGSALATIGLTIPAVAVASYVLDLPLALGLGGKGMVLLALTLFVAALSLARGRTTVLHGAVHLVIFAAYLVTTILP